MLTVIGCYADLTLGGYIRLLEDRANWERLGFDHHRKTFIRCCLESVRRIRNEVMHFDQGSEKTNRLFPVPGCSSVVSRRLSRVLSDEPVLTATYCTPSTA